MRQLLFGSNPRRTFIRAAVLIAMAFVLFRYVLIPVRLEGISMLPTYRAGSINFTNRLAYMIGQPARGDVVAIRMAGPSVVYVKRIIGMPGERVEIAAGVVLIDGQPLIEPTVVDRALWFMPAFTVGSDEYFVIGDNRSMAIENHDLGKASRDRILGKMLF